jgi:hypothetical protein
MVGVGCSAMIFFRKVRPSMRGISMSSTITSGHWLFIFSRAQDRIGRHADDLHVRLAGLAIDLAHHGRVVDDHYLDLVGHGQGGRR